MGVENYIAVEAQTWRERAMDSCRVALWKAVLMKFAVLGIGHAQAAHVVVAQVQPEEMDVGNFGAAVWARGPWVELENA